MNEDLANKLYSIKEKVFSFINEAESFLNKVILLGIIFAVAIWLNLGRIIEFAVSENRIKNNIERSLQEATGRKTQVAGEVSFTTKPEPVIVINNVNVHNGPASPDSEYFHADVIRSKPSVIRAILGKADFNNLFLENVVMNIPVGGSENKGAYEQLAHIFSKDSLFKDKRLKFKNLKVNILKPSPLEGGRTIIRSFSFSELDLNPSPDKKNVKFEIKGAISSKKLSENYLFSLDINQGLGRQSDYSGRIYSDGSELKLSGKLDTGEKFFFDGKIQGKCVGIAKKFFSVLGTSDEFLANLREDDESNIEADYKFDNKLFEISKFTAEGKVISFGLTSKTEIGQKVSSVVDIKVSNLEYSQLFKSYLEMVSEKKAKMIERDFKKKLEEYFLFSIGDDVNFLFTLDAPSIKFFHGSEGSLKLSVILKDNNFKVKEFSAKLPGDSSLNLVSEVEINKEKKQLKGTARVVFMGKSMDDFTAGIDSTTPKRVEKRFGQFYVDAKAFLYGQNIHFREIVAKIDTDTFAGQILADYSDSFKASAAFNFTSLNIDKYLFDDNKDDFGMTQQENPLASKFDLLRIVDSIFDRLDVSLIADSMMKAGHNFTDVSIYAQITPGVTEVKDIFFNSDIMGQVKGNARFDLRDFQPKLDINMLMDSYDADLLMYDEIIKQNDKYVFDGKWSAEKVSFERLGNFLGKIDIKVSQLRIFHLLLNNFAMKSHADEGKFVIDQARADLFGNKIDFKGYLTTDYPSLTLSFIASELNSSDFMKDTLKLEQINSIFNMSGAIATNGYSIEQMVQNLKGNISIATKGFTVRGFGVDAISKALPLAKRREHIKLIADELLGKGDAEFNFFIGAFSIDSGHITFENLPVAGPNILNAKVSGDLDLNKWEISMNSTMDIVTSDKSTFALSGKTSGSLSNIHTVWDTSGMTKYWEQHFFNGR